MDKVNNNFVIVNDVFRSDLDIHINTFTDNHLLLYVYLQRFNNYRDEINFCLGWLYDELNISNRRLQSELVICFSDLIEFELIEVVGDIDIMSINRNTRLVVKLIKNEDNSNFTMLYDSEIDKILNLEVDIRQKKSALLIYTIIASRINNTTRYSFPSYKNFMDDLGMENNNRVSESIKLLQDEGLIVWKNVGTVAIRGDVETGNNVYVLCTEDNYKTILEGAVADRTESYKERGYSIIRSKDGNKKRSLSALIRNRQAKFDNGTLDNKGSIELLQYEKEYFELIKDNEEQVAKQRFILFDVENDMETGEILDVEELSEENIIDNLFTSTDEVVEDNIKNLFVKRKPKESKKYDFEKFVDKDISDLINDDFIDFEEIFG